MTTPVSRLELITDAARLVRYACQPRRKPLGDADYHDLVERYRTTPGFREVVDAIAEGMTLHVITGHSQEGLRVSAATGGLFAFKLSDLPAKMRDPKDRLVYGLIHVAIAAHAYPTPGDLEEESIKRVSVQEIDAFVRHLIQRLKEDTEDDAGLLPALKATQAAWNAYDALPSHRLTPKGRLSPNSSLGRTKSVMDWLVNQGYAQQAGSLGPMQYRLLNSFRLQVAGAAALPAFQKITDVRRKQIAGTAPATPEEN
ncbi:hypothetical protein V1460_29980 [Streptomyces sp. SCSIO 30461]|uniref:hypothetical protein n=1 Tax=Streptomyces sp. SCSIO 30461 TaxID=3118085 RepID=UPI0030CF664D